MSRAPILSLFSQVVIQLVVSLEKLKGSGMICG